MNLRGIGLFWICLIVPLSGVAAAPDPAEASIRELARKWLVFNDGVGLSIGVYANGQRQFYNFGTTRLDGNKVEEGRAILRDANHPLVTLAETMDEGADKAAELANA